MIEIEFIPIGEETNTGDAILCHFTEPGTTTDRVVLIDGGFADSSGPIIAHIDAYYPTSVIDLMVCTHPDNDHINGLFGVLDKMTVRNLLIHRPRDFGFSSDAVAADKVDDLIRTARSHGVKVITDAFAGTTIFGDVIHVAGPSRELYVSLLSEQEAEAGGGHGSFNSGSLREVPADPGGPVLTDNGGTTARNNSSIVLDIQVDGRRALMTGDAGVPALTAVADHLDRVGRATQLPDFFDVPHHGSRHNLTGALLDRLIGPRGGDENVRSAFVSVGKKADDFPRPEVANALKRRGCRVSATRGQTIRWFNGATQRDGWHELTPLPWFELPK
ncbi:hypothetical protein QUG98_05390 [Curtobacterium sp. RHCJP20]|uniref:Metallo-beta-lactamase domain-containing protein n=1 Tax=Curtobacterium subtropicum TaxID=3055138 RepID=A0ABT7TE80_9MICO|nr:hypothetical protein [Curtobacterium subtropicum]MDM7887885.1 hypothetical protein [Curtobacterium subtropicum]